MFVDKAKIHIKSGDGGNGMVAWRKEKYVPFGGPAGGDGGKGGDITIEAVSDMNTLLDFKYQSIFKAVDGEKGGIKNMHGKNGKDLIIKVPCGTIIRDPDNGNAIADLTHPGDKVVVASGGRGGRGNARFNTSVRQSPQFSEPGEPGIERELELELKLIADVGIIGLPNAGKSTLISVVSAAKPKIANYPFTTLAPNLGVVRKPDGKTIVLADIPGLVEGASEGTGLGHEFLRHVERTRLLLHLVDVSAAEEDAEAPMRNYELINEELQKYSAKLGKKPQILVLSKTDLSIPEIVEELQEQFTKKVPDPLFTISSATRSGTDALMKSVFEKLDHLPPDDTVVEVMPDEKAFDHDDSEFEIVRDGDVFEVTGGKITRLFGITDMRNREAVHRLMNIIKAMGVYEELARVGAEEGHTVKMGGIEFDYVPDESLS